MLRCKIKNVKFIQQSDKGKIKTFKFRYAIRTSYNILTDKSL